MTPMLAVVTHKSRRGREVFLAKIISMEPKEDGIYFGYIPVDPKFGHWGYAMLYPDPRSYGVQRVFVLGEVDVVRRRSRPTPALH